MVLIVPRTVLGRKLFCCTVSTQRNFIIHHSLHRVTLNATHNLLHNLALYLLDVVLIL